MNGRLGGIAGRSISDYQQTSPDFPFAYGGIGKSLPAVTVLVPQTRLWQAGRILVIAAKWETWGMTGWTEYEHMRASGNDLS